MNVGSFLHNHHSNPVPIPGQSFPRRKKRKGSNKLHLTTKFPLLTAPPVAAANPPPRFVPDDEDDGGGSVINACKLRSFHAGSRVFCCAR